MPEFLSPEEQERYARQIGEGVLSVEGQEKLKRSSVLISRVGGMGGPAAQMLVMAGVGRVTIAHGGPLISPDLNRQVLGSESGLGLPRAPRFAEYLRSLNRFVDVVAIEHEPDDDEARDLATEQSLVLSCPPTFEERLRLNRAARDVGIPFIDAAQWGMSGTLTVMQAGQTACLECLYPQPPSFETFFPVVGAISSAVGSLAALEAVKILSGCGQPAWGRMLTYDGFRARCWWASLQRRPDCGCCRGMDASDIAPLDNDEEPS